MTVLFVIVTGSLVAIVTAGVLLVDDQHPVYVPPALIVVGPLHDGVVVVVVGSVVVVGGIVVVVVTPVVVVGLVVVVVGHLCGLHFGAGFCAVALSVPYKTHAMTTTSRTVQFTATRLRVDHDDDEPNMDGTAHLLAPPALVRKSTRR